MSSPTQFKGKVIAITGGASGIGLATAHLLASRGASLSLADIQETSLEEAKAEILAKHQTDIFTFAVDVRDYAKVESWISSTVSHFGHLDGAANLAGVIPKDIGLGSLVNQDLEDWNFVLAVNLTGVLHCLKAQLKVLNDNGAIVNASSIAGLQGRAKNSSYAASKHGVLGLTRSAAKEVGEKGIRVNAICPGRIETPMARAAVQIASGGAGGEDAKHEKETTMDVALRRSGRAEEVAMLIAFLLSSESSYITGNSISIDGGWNC
ncbi:3-oxoacyl-reductase [Tothia fuscella]|uniref:3-oxoacyl-reductase n=1 Tax=Tothia fuscella TaxID=1048955 RepID=A0A9P4TTK5_9PEZI|nr:3-oxoacyl-reductase [Tothia fuscella]